ncbi:MAG: HAD family hydrolase [Cyanobacteria bacterium J06648_11]
METRLGRPELLALDFDGVLCNGLREYFQTAWRAYAQIWSPGESEPPAGLADRFYRLRPVIETGWEMPVLLRSLLSGTDDAAILTDWLGVSQSLVAREQLDPVTLARAVDGARDAWLERDVEGWLALHDFFPGAIEFLEQLERDRLPWVIVTTKESRFVRQLLADCGLDLCGDRLFGKDVGRPKFETLEKLVAERGVASDRLWFVEDRLPALLAASARPKLAGIKLFLAEWGYTTDEQRHQARESDFVELLSLPAFVGGVERWHEVGVS